MRPSDSQRGSPQERGRHHRRATGEDAGLSEALRPRHAQQDGWGTSVAANTLNVSPLISLITLIMSWSAPISVISSRGFVSRSNTGKIRHSRPACGAIAQLGERIVRNDEVVGSIPTSSTNLTNLFSAAYNTFQPMYRFCTVI